MNKSLLSREGLERKSKMLDQIKLDWLEAKRRIRLRNTAATVVVSLLVCLVLILAQAPGVQRFGGTIVQSTNVLESDSTESVPSTRPLVDWETEHYYQWNPEEIVAETDPSVSERYVVKSSEIDISAIEYVDDDDLDTALSEFGAKYAIATIAGERKAFPAGN